MENQTQITTPAEGELRSLVQDQYDRYLPMVAKTAPQLHRELLTRSGEVASLSEEAFVDEKTSYLGLTLPHAFNLLERDVLRLRDALTGVDVFAQNADLRLTGAEQELARKADASGTDSALRALGGRVDQVAAELAGDISQLSGAVKTAHDKGVEGVSAAAAAKAAADAAQGTANAAKQITDLVTTVPAAWRVAQAGPDGKLAAGWFGNGGGMIPAGHIAMLPFRHNELPSGWYFCNGMRYGNGSPQGIALNALPATLKYDWGINNDGSTTSVPNWFYGGRGPVMRAVDGSSRFPGSVEDGAIQNITGNTGGGVYGLSQPYGVFYRSSFISDGSFNVSGTQSWSLIFDASRAVATANEVRMLNRGMTPAIFLGV